MMMSGPLPLCTAAVTRVWMSFWLMRSICTSTPACLLNSAACASKTLSAAGMKCDHCSRRSVVPCAKAGARPSAAAPAVTARKRRRLTVTLIVAPLSSGWTTGSGDVDPRPARGGGGGGVEHELCAQPILERRRGCGARADGVQHACDQRRDGAAADLLERLGALDGGHPRTRRHRFEGAAAREPQLSGPPRRRLAPQPVLHGAGAAVRLQRCFVHTVRDTARRERHLSAVHQLAEHDTPVLGVGRS